AFPESTEYRVELAYSLFAAAASLGTDLIPKQAHRQVREVCQKLPPEEQRALARRYDELASQLVTDPDPTLRQPHRVVELANKAVELGPNEKTDWGTVWDTLGLACYRAGDWKGAVEALNKSRSLDVRNRHPDVRALFVLSMAYWKQGAEDEARKWYTLAIVYTENRMPNRAEIPSLRREAAAVLEHSGKAADLAPKALTDCLHVLALHLDVDPKAAWAYRARGQIYFGQRNYDKAAADFAKVTDLKPLDPQAWFDRGVAHYRAGDWKAASETLKKADGLTRGTMFGHNGFFIAMAQEQLGARPEARQWYTAALVWMEKRAPRNEELVRFRAEAAALLSLSERAADLAPQALSDDLQY